MLDITELRLVIALVLASIWTTSIDAAPRSNAAKTAFKRTYPCPATGKVSGACPGHVVDHITPLCAGGADVPDNMQWQTLDAAKAKDRDEHALCRRLRAAKMVAPA